MTTLFANSQVVALIIDLKQHTFSVEHHNNAISLKMVIDSKTWLLFGECKRGPPWFGG
jgi:hypothetical protein